MPTKINPVSSEKILSLQWHLTDRCNWRCKHCYAEGYEGVELELVELKRIFLQYIALLKSQKKLGRLNLTGGEPFVREDFLEFLEFISDYGKYFSLCSVLTNGSLLTPKILKFIKTKTCVTGIQISIEGDEKINDAIRGEGSFQKILDAAALCKRAGIQVHLAATVSKLNFPQIFDLLDLLLIYDIPLFLRRFVPIGNGKKERDALLSPEELRQMYLIAAKLNKKFKLRNGGRIFQTNMCSSSLKSLLWSQCDFRTCGAKDSNCFTLMPNGEVYPCRLLPISLGNICETSLQEIFATTRKDFVKKGEYDEECKSCEFFQKCKGGAACVAYPLTGNPFARDPQCFKKCLKK